LARSNIAISRKRIGRLMASAGLACKTKHRFKATTDSKNNNPISPNLLQRQFDVIKPDKYWVGDINYIPTKNGWLYLTTVIDLYSRQIVGWSMR
jgi:transposase InsO family protein